MLLNNFLYLGMMLFKHIIKGFVKDNNVIRKGGGTFLDQLGQLEKSADILCIEWLFA